MKGQLRTIKQFEDHRARICLEMVCEFMRTKSEDVSTKDVALVEFQQRVGAKILSPNESEEYVLYRKKYREKKKIIQQKREDARAKIY